MWQTLYLLFLLFYFNFKIFQFFFTTFYYFDLAFYYPSSFFNLNFLAPIVSLLFHSYFFALVLSLFFPYGFISCLPNRIRLSCCWETILTYRPFCRVLSFLGSCSLSENQARFGFHWAAYPLHCQLLVSSVGAFFFRFSSVGADWPARDRARWWQKKHDAGKTHPKHVSFLVKHAYLNHLALIDSDVKFSPRFLTLPSPCTRRSRRSLRGRWRTPWPKW